MTAATVAAWPPRWLTPVPQEDLVRGDGELYADLIGALCRITKDSVAGPAGEVMAVREWQRQILLHVYARRADGRFRHRTALVGIGRKNGKSGLGAGMALGGMLLGPQGGEVYSCAADRKQAGIVFDTAKRMVELEPELGRAIKVYRDVLEVPATGTTYRALSAEAFTKEGLNPHAVIFDEVHAQPTRELWDVMQLAMGARREPLMIGITTAGVRTDRTGGHSLCYGMYLHGVKVCTHELDDPTFFMAWWEPRAGAEADHTDPATWLEANPGYDDLVSAEDFQAVVGRTPENEFRTKRCNQWVSAANAWLPGGVWEALAKPDRYPDGKPPKGAKIVLAFDGSKTGDCTALRGWTVDDRPYAFTVGIWERDPDADNWKVPRAEVKNRLREACRTWDVVEVAWDDFMWQDAREELEDEGIPIEVYPQTAERMGKATQRFYEAAVAQDGDVRGLFDHDGDPVAARHIANATYKPTNRGLARIVKQSGDSVAWIDSAVCDLMGLDRAEWWHQNGKPDTFHIY